MTDKEMTDRLLLGEKGASWEKTLTSINSRKLNKTAYLKPHNYSFHFLPHPPNKKKNTQVTKDTNQKQTYTIPRYCEEHISSQRNLNCHNKH